MAATSLPVRTSRSQRKGEGSAIPVLDQFDIDNTSDQGDVSSGDGHHGRNGSRRSSRTTTSPTWRRATNGARPRTTDLAEKAGDLAADQR